MGRAKKVSKTKTYRMIIQGFFLIFSIFFLVAFYPSQEFMLTTLVVLLLITILFRTGFCGWFCPLGTIFDFIRGLGKKIGGLSMMKPINKRYKKWVKKNRGVLDTIDKYARGLKYLLVLWILQAAFLSIGSIKEGDEHGIIALLYPLIAILILGLFVDRSWCKYACPLGATLGIFGRLSFSRVTRNEQSCINCKLCSKSCPMNIDVATLQYVNKLDCNTCLSCVDACPVDGALDLTMHVPFTEKQSIPSVETMEKQAVK